MVSVDFRTRHESEVQPIDFAEFHDGTLAVTVYHALKMEVQALSRFAWRCGRCGRIYRRQRRTIQPRRHHCGSCRGALHEVSSTDFVPPVPSDACTAKPSRTCDLPRQLELDFSGATH